jgi:hypothetical protein
MKIAVTCPHCEGHKRLPCRTCGGIGGEKYICWDCHGRASKPCPECQGEGEILVEAELENLCIAEPPSSLSSCDFTS